MEVNKNNYLLDLTDWNLAEPLFRFVLTECWGDYVIKRQEEKLSIAEYVQLYAWRAFSDWYKDRSVGS